ncbi:MULTISPECIES: 8-amino-7-oxononanoate synthase [unclassified Ruegeria]|uniref:8-amino-7-oxononanoate synthase n=1 Tax=unclassified Ruegeria TaxID=2625375 RepID=UPI001487A234|nr:MULTISPECIES: 8-amino-7-oxononanoate synthase [unclassified Ruegeria]NOD34373.1 aminotransferase class I/II-fold pyridoxal phosphate-dependent enzyme [Ruegeria sp. HKCCD7296]NOD47493.1 aminotransferase class I/II-fold pyridoxal phosphate-dependent enzyme [Ruegeria sp. HKCCD5849]NOD53114.1 aminotransferase class I/II-fold pyridoxal phosphate-dependent enzyme [Ruegeria sp. HKCCD5851]NOD66307.1 aminotransferase class I/II-fold pyridoxal phosphate-dependent enzyme [Ruegeria sp. HKCCD7303]NOE342
MKAVDRLESMLDALEARHRRRALIPAQGLDFASNDYLGLAGSKLLQDAAKAALARGVPVGSGGSRLLRGNHPEHEALEQEAAAFFGSEAALFMGGGFQANQAIFSTLPAAGDLVLYDALVHASAHEGMRASRADLRAFRHNDVEDARKVLAEWQSTGGSGHIWIAVESVYSMEGDLAPLEDLASLAREADAVLIVDEAHATGVFGLNGKGLAHGLSAEVLTLHTCGKGLGVSGGLICGPRVMIDTLINRARPFIFATAPSPLNAALVRATLRELATNAQLVAAAHDRLRHAHHVARQTGLPDSALTSQIIPVILGDEARTMATASALQQQGFDIRGIRPPTVPKGTSRLRVSITGNVTHEDISALFATIASHQSEAA